MTDVHTKAVAIIDRDASDNIHPLARLALSRDGAVDPLMLEKLLAVQQKWEADEARKKYSIALVDLKRDLPTVIGRDQKVEFGNTRYSHASLGAVMDAVTGPLTMHGFSLSWDPSSTPTTVTVKCRLVHAAGHFEECTLSGPVDAKGSKSPVQGVMSTVTMLERYTALALLGIATRDQPDADEKPEIPEPSTDRVDTNRNLAAVDKLKKYGKTRAEAEEYLGTTIAGWTVADLSKLQAWAKGDGPKEAA